jgi:hypothetical protein
MRPATRLKLVVLGLMGAWAVGAAWYFASEDAAQQKAAAAARAAAPPPVTWKTDTAGWALPMPASDAYAGIAARRVSFRRESAGAVLILEEVVIERRGPAGALTRSELQFTLENTYIPDPSGPGVARGPNYGQPRTRFGDRLSLKAEQMDLRQLASPGDVLRLDRVTARFAGDRAKCLEEPCYAYLTLNDGGAGGQRVAHSRSHPVNYSPGAPYVAGR